MITLIYAQDQKGGIGLDNDIPWSLPKDLQHFKQETMGYPIVMGRRTFESMGQRLLPGRQTYVISRQLDYGSDIEGLTVLTDLQQVLDLAQDQEIMVIGGSEVYQALMPWADRIIRTVIEGNFSCDTFMSEIDEDVFVLERRLEGETDEANPHSHVFEYWQRR